MVREPQKSRHRTKLFDAATPGPRLEDLSTLRHLISELIAEIRGQSESPTFQGMALMAIGARTGHVLPVLTKRDGTPRQRIGWDCGELTHLVDPGPPYFPPVGRDRRGSTVMHGFTRLSVQDLTGVPSGSLKKLRAGMVFAGACISAQRATWTQRLNLRNPQALRGPHLTALGPRTAYTAEKWQQIAGFFELDAASEVVWIKPMIADWWLAGGGNVESLRNLVQGHRSARDFKRDYFDSVPPIYMEPIYGSE